MHKFSTTPPISTSDAIRRRLGGPDRRPRSVPPSTRRFCAHGWSRHPTSLLIAYANLMADQFEAPRRARCPVPASCSPRAPAASKQPGLLPAELRHREEMLSEEDAARRPAAANQRHRAQRSLACPVSGADFPLRCRQDPPAYRSRVGPACPISALLPALGRHVPRHRRPRPSSGRRRDEQHLRRHGEGGTALSA